MTPGLVIHSSHSKADLEEIPLSKSLGYSIRKKLTGSLEDDRLNKEFMEQYQEMLKASQESLGTIDALTRNMRGVVDDEDINVLKSAEQADHRRRAPEIQSEFRKRHARSQAIRKKKLSVQSLKNHVQHSKKHSLD
ncbi:uncharacterized protein LOC101740418 isoform X2 [Bombyx mori]|uniref:uncharacterized protein LOC101740418 isoform X2 n=1 Tax=Bombyx mori TaxID=7091 RepID=UPI002ED68A7C